MDTETGMYYLMSRYYDPVTHRFLNADGYFQTGLGILDANMNIYCGNNPVNYFDPMGMDCICLHQRVRGNHVCKNTRAIDSSVSIRTVFDGVNTGAQVLTNSLSQSAKSYLYNSTRPVNIGIGSYNKSIAMQIKKINNFTTEANRFFNKAGNIIGVASIALDVGFGIYDNVQAGCSWDKIASDATVDLCISGGSVLAAGAAGSAIGTALGTVFPGVGNIIGAGAGFMLGIVFYTFTDVIEFNGKTVRTLAKEGVYSLC